MTYTTITDVSLYLGKTAAGLTTLTADQEEQATNLLAVADSYINRVTRRTWNDGPITAERYDLIKPWVFLKHRPIASIQLVQHRTSQVGDVLTTLVAGIDYEMVDATRGEVRFAFGYQGQNQIVLVSYTPNRPVPADISHAAALIVSHSLYMQLFPDRWGIDNAQMDADTRITYVEGPVSIDIPETAQKIIDGYILPVLA